MGTITQDLQQDRLIALSEVAAQDFPAGSLYVVGMPIGNAADITLRAIWILSRVDLIAAEDTRVTRPFLARYGIETPVLAAHQHNERAMAQQVVERLARGERIAVVTDAGTPGVSDPGALMVRSALDAGLRVVPVPGPSSAIAALSVSGLGAGPLVFVGFLPTGAQQRNRILRTLAAEKGHLRCSRRRIESPSCWRSFRPCLNRRGESCWRARCPKSSRPFQPMWHRS